jgi:hypothetical protein
MTGLPASNPSSRPRTDRPYVVCDTCGHMWSVWVEPAECENCSHDALWAFPTVDAALAQSRLVRDRL